MKKSGSDKAGTPAAATKDTKGGGAALSQSPQAGNAPPPNGPSYGDLQAQLTKALDENTDLRKQVGEQEAQVADMDQELNHLEEELASVRQNEEALTKKNQDLQAQVQDLKTNLQKAQAAAAVAATSSKASAAAPAATAPLMEPTTPGGTGSYKQAMQRLIEEHKAREEAEERYSILAEKYSQMKEATGWAEIEGSAYMGDGRNRVLGGEVGKLVLQGYQRKIKDTYSFAEKLEGLASRLELLCLHSAAEEMTRHAQGLQSAASEAM